MFRVRVHVLIYIQEDGVRLPRVIQDQDMRLM